MNERLEVYDKPKSKMKGRMIVASIVIVLGLVLVGSGVYLLSQPKYIFQESYNYLTKGFKVNEGNNKLMNLIKENDKVKYTGDMNININKDLELGIENIDLKLELAEDKKNKTTRIYMNSKIDNQDLMEIISYLKDDKMYITISEIMDKYYYEEQEYVSVFESSETEDLEILVDSISSSIKKVITNDKFEKSKATTTIDGKDVECTKLSLVVTDNLLSELGTQIINDLKANDEAMAALVKLTGETQENLLEGMNTTLEDIKETTGETYFTYNMYYKNMNSIQKLEITAETANLSYTANNDKYVVSYQEDSKTLFELSIAKENEQYNILLDTESLDATGTYKETDKESELTVKLTDESSQELGQLTVKSTVKSDTSSTSQIIVTTEGTQIATITLDSSFTFNEELPQVNLATSKPTDEMTEEEATTIMTNLQNHAIIGPFMTMFDSSMGSDSLEDTYEDDYYYDYEEDYSDDFSY